MDEELSSYVHDWVTSDEDNSHLCILLVISTVILLAVGIFVILSLA